MQPSPARALSVCWISNRLATSEPSESDGTAEDLSKGSGAGDKLASWVSVGHPPSIIKLTFQEENENRIEEDQG